MNINEQIEHADDALTAYLAALHKINQSKLTAEQVAYYNALNSMSVASCEMMRHLKNTCKD